MKNSNSHFTTKNSTAEDISSANDQAQESSYRRVTSLTDRMTSTFENDPELTVEPCDEIPDHALTVCLQRCRDIIGNGQMGELEALAVQDCAKENLHGLTSLKKEFQEAEAEYQRLNAKAEPFFEKMAPLLDDEEAGITGFDAARMDSLKQTLTECVQAVTFAKYRRDALRQRMDVVVNYVTHQVVDNVRSRNLANPHLGNIENKVKSALSKWS